MSGEPARDVAASGSPPMLTLHFAPYTISLATHIVLEEVEARYELVFVDLLREEQRSPEYRALNPLGRVPTLVTEEGALTETPALLAYLAERFPAAKLSPATPFQRARAAAFNSYLASTVHVAHAHRMRGYRWADEPEAIAAMQRKVPRSVHDAFALIEQHHLAGPWVMGEQYTICDPYLFTLAQWLEVDGVDPSALPRVREHRARVAERPAVQRAFAAQLAAAPR